MRNTPRSLNMKCINRRYALPDLSSKRTFKSIIDDDPQYQMINFTKNYESTIDLIEVQTYGLLSRLFNENEFYMFTTYFKLNMNFLFINLNITNKKFTGADNKLYNIPQANGYIDLSEEYIPELKATTIEIPYNNDTAYKFWIIFPDKSTNIQEISKILSSEIIANIKLKPETVKLNLPIFKIETSFDGNFLSQNFNLTTELDKTEMELSENDYFAIGDVLQKNRIVMSVKGNQILDSLGKIYVEVIIIRF